MTEKQWNDKSVSARKRLLDDAGYPKHWGHRAWAGIPKGIQFDVGYAFLRQVSKNTKLTPSVQVAV